jgi:hypothetical protein
MPETLSSHVLSCYLIIEASEVIESRNSNADGMRISVPTDSLDTPKMGTK